MEDSSKDKLNMVAYTCNPSTREREAGASRVRVIVNYIINKYEARHAYMGPCH